MEFMETIKISKSYLKELPYESWTCIEYLYFNKINMEYNLFYFIELHQ